MSIAKQRLQHDIYISFWTSWGFSIGYWMGTDKVAEAIVVGFLFFAIISVIHAIIYTIRSFREDRQ